MNCEQVWQDALRSCREILGEEDYEIVLGFENPDKLMQAIQETEKTYRTGGIPRLLHRIQPNLSRLTNFVTILLFWLGPNNISTACLWGVLSLLIHLASESERTLNEIAGTLNDLGQRLALFEVYSDGLALDPALTEALFDILVDLVLCSVTAIKHFRKSGIQNATSFMSWTTIHGDFVTLLQEISNKVAHLKELVEAEQILSMKQQKSDYAKLLEQISRINLSQSSTGDQQPTVSLPTQTLPFSRNQVFYGRENILQQISEHFENYEKTHGIHKMAIWGLGGIGKSQIALEYAHRQYENGCQIVLWIGSETNAEATSAFHKAANQLRVPGLLPTNTPDQNRYLVLNFLQNTKIPWLLVFDNIEDAEVLKDSWPVTGNGCILITCRSENMAIALCSKSIEIPAFTAEEGSSLLLNVIGLSNPSEKEKQCSIELSEQLGGLALALDIMAKQIKIRKESIEKFLAFYYSNRRLFNKQPKGGRNPYYSRDLDTVWETSFLNLSRTAAALMRLLCFVAPEDIPDSLFTEGKDLPPGYAFLADPEQWDEAKMELLSYSLIAINPKNSLMTIHRLTREAYFDRMDNPQRLEAFSIVLTLLRDPFKRISGSHLYNRWNICSRLIQHVQALGERYLQLEDRKFYAPQPELSIVLNDAAWYLVETGFFRGSLNLLEIAKINCVNKRSLVYADLLDTFGTVDERQSHTERALESFQEMLDISLALCDSVDERVPGAYNAVTNGLVGLWRAEEALQYANKAVDYGPRDPAERVKLNPDRYLRCRACAHLYNDDTVNARKDLEEADYWQNIKHGRNSHYHGEAAYLHIKVAAKEGNLEEAYECGERAFRLLSPGKPTHMFVAATRYQQGIIRKRQQRYEDALHHLEDALTIYEFNEISNGVSAYAGPTARCKWQMSQLLVILGRPLDAQILLEQAESAKNELYGTGLFLEMPDEEGSYDSLVALLFR